MAQAIGRGKSCSVVWLHSASRVRGPWPKLLGGGSHAVLCGSTQLRGPWPKLLGGGSHAVLCGSTQLAGCEVHGPSYWEGEVMQCCVAPS